MNHWLSLRLQGICCFDQFHDMEGLNEIAKARLLQFFTIVSEWREQVARFVETPRDSFIG